MANIFFSKSPQETKKIGKDLAKKIKKDRLKEKANVLAFLGDLGGGKTTFLQGFAEGLGIEEKILSPTFVILKRFKISGSEFKNFYHLDCYRIKNARDILDLGFKDVLLFPGNIVAVEWAGKIKKILPESATWIELKFVNNKKRKITISE